MTAVRYHLPDEPRPGGLSRYAVDPMWPLLAVMLAGNVFGLAWFVFNAAALGSSARIREWSLAAASLVGCIVLLVLLALAGEMGWLGPSAMRYASLSVVAWKLLCGYAIYLSQQRSCELWQYFGGNPANGLPVVIVLTMLGGNLLNRIPMPWLVEVLK